MEQIKRNYLDLVSLAINTARKGVHSQTVAPSSLPVLKGGYAISGVHLKDYPRLTGDLDFESNNFYPEDTERRLLLEQKVLDGAEEIIRDFFIGKYGAEIKKKLQVTTQTKLSVMNTIKSKINIEGADISLPLSVKIEVSEQDSTTRTDLKPIQNKDNFGNLGDQDILVGSLSNIFLNKIIAFLNRSCNGFDNADFFSRTKDLFDIHSLLGNDHHLLTMPEDEIREMLQKEAGRIQTIKKYFESSHEEFFSLYFLNMKRFLKDGESKSRQELFRRMTLGYNQDKEDQFANVDDVLDSFDQASLLLKNALEI